MAFDSGHSGWGDLERVKAFGWLWLTPLTSNRPIHPDRTQNPAISDVLLPADGNIVPLNRYGLVNAFRLLTKNADTPSWATHDLSRSTFIQQRFAQHRWVIEVFQRDLKPQCGVAHGQTSSVIAQRHPVHFAMRAFFRLERYVYLTGIRIMDAKNNILRYALRCCLSAPLYDLVATA